MGRPGFEPGLRPCEGRVLTRLDHRPGLQLPLLSSNKDSDSNDAGRAIDNVRCGNRFEIRSRRLELMSYDDKRS